jgi:hypothetical protein
MNTIGPGARLTPIIPATKEVEIRRIKIWGQPQQKARLKITKMPSTQDTHTYTEFTKSSLK